MKPSASLLEIEGLRLDIGGQPVLKGVDLSVASGETVALVGESGSGKSMTALTVMQLLPQAARTSGRVTFDGIDILSATEDQMCALRGDDVGMVFQEPMTGPTAPTPKPLPAGCSTGSARRRRNSRSRAIRTSFPAASASASSSPSPAHSSRSC
jgi:peptide/nickel transport system ATP-binding protein